MDSNIDEAWLVSQNLKKLILSGLFDSSKIRWLQLKNQILIIFEKPKIRKFSDNLENRVVYHFSFNIFEF
jgi:hypothetical protein